MAGKNIEKKKVVVAMSGGVDSSVAAAMLKKQGYDVIGVFMRFWAEPLVASRQSLVAGNTCCSEGAEQAARDVAEKIKIPFYVLNVQKGFKKAVVDYFLAAEKSGLTPNPCVVCNKKIKFGLLFEKALGMGADFIATGHYARIKTLNVKSQTPNGLWKAKDEDKDQTYFLYNLTQEKLSRVLFPVGDFKKDGIYALAKKWKLPYRKGESFDLCFVANDRESFLQRYLKMKKGKIVNLTHPSPLFKKEREPERVLGEHQGLALYTIGQRKNLPLQQGPWWVVKKDEKKNILYVSNDEKDLYSKELVVENINWLPDNASKLPMKVLAKIRYKSEEAEATLQQSQGKNYKVIFKKPQRAITPGQSVVFYSKKGELLGGGVII